MRAQKKCQNLSLRRIIARYGGGAKLTQILQLARDVELGLEFGVDERLVAQHIRRLTGEDAERLVCRETALAKAMGVALTGEPGRRGGGVADEATGPRAIGVPATRPGK